MAADETLDERTLKLAALLRSLGLDPTDWYIADESVFALLGHAVPMPAEEKPTFVIHIDAGRLPFVPAAEGTLSLSLSQGTAALEAVEAFSQRHGVTLTFIPFTRHALPITFRKLVERGDGPIGVASLRGLAKIWLGELIELASSASSNASASEPLASPSTSTQRLLALAEVDWPSRDRWFGAFCGELGAILGSAAESAVSSNKLQRLGRKYSLM